MVKGIKEKSASTTVMLDRCYLSGACFDEVIACIRSKGALGGDLQAFSYDFSAMVWMRLADLRHIMSRYTLKYRGIWLEWTN